MEIFPLHFDFFALDISDLSIKILKLKKKKKGFSISSFGSFQMESGIVEGGIVKDTQRLSLEIKKALENVRGERIKTKNVVLSLPDEKSFLQIIKLPVMSPQEMRSAIPFESENYIPIPIDQVYLDYQKIPTPEISSFLEVLVCACPKEVADPYIASLETLGLRPVGLEPESLSLTRAVIGPEDQDSSVLIADMGATKTLFAIFSQRAVRFIFVNPISGNHLTGMIAKNLKIPFEKAEALKKEYGIGDKIILKFDKGEEVFESYNKEIWEAILPSMVDLSQQMKKVFTFFETHDSHEALGRKIQKVILTGGGANLQGLKEFLQVQLKVEVEVVDPLKYLNLSERPPFSLEEALTFTTAIGLAKKEI